MGVSLRRPSFSCFLGRSSDDLMIFFIRNCLLLVLAALWGVVLAQETGMEEGPPWTLEELRTHCIPLWAEADVANESDCEVREFGEIAEVGGTRLYWALYHDRRQRISELLAESMTWLGYNSILVFFRQESSDEDMATVDFVRSNATMYYQPPRPISTDRGLILFSEGHDCCDSKAQFWNHRSWLWRSGAWTELDIHRWYREFQMPTGYGLKGVSGDLASALSTQTLNVSVFRDGDGDCCPTGGFVRIQFELDNLALRVVGYEHFPD